MFASLSNAYDTLLAFQEAVENARREDYFGQATTYRGSNPRVNIFQSGDDIVLTAELPGLKKEDIKLEIKENLLRIAGNREIQYPENASIHRIERRNYNFDRTLRLPHRVENDQVKAEFHNGVLKVTLPRAEKDKPKNIEIN